VSKIVKNSFSIKWPTPDPFTEANATDDLIGPNSVLPEPGKPPEYYEAGMDVYSAEFHEKICKEAQIIGGIRLYDLVFVMANEIAYVELLPILWKTSGLNDEENDRFPTWNTKMGQNQYMRAMVWYWLLCSWTIFDKLLGKFPKKSYYFGKIEDENDILWERRFSLIPLYRFENGIFKEIKEDQKQSPYYFLKIDEFKEYLKDLGEKNFGKPILLPKTLFEDHDEADPIPSQVKAIMKSSFQEVEKFYQTIKKSQIPSTSKGLEEKWREVVLDFFQQSGIKFKVVRENYLKDKQLYSVHPSNPKRDFVAALYKKILKDKNIEPPSISKLYSYHSKLLRK
jgi:hypothetical protein